MAEETQITPRKGSLPDSAANIEAETLMAAGDALSKSMLFALRRDYLNGHVFENDFVQLLPDTPPQQQDIAFFEVEQVGKPVESTPQEYLAAIQTTLAACHDPRYRLVFLISSDGLRTRIFFGVSAQAGGTQPSIFAEQLGQFLCSNWPGTRVRMVSDYKRIVDQVHVPLSKYRYARAFTGIPSPKSTGKTDEYQDSLGRFVRGLRGKPYVYMVLAEPLPEETVGEIVTACQSLAGQVHAFTKTTLQNSRSSGLSETTTKTESDTATQGTSQNTTESKTDSKSKGVLGTTLDKSGGIGKGVKAVGVAGLSGLLLAAGGPFLLSGMLGMFGQLLPSGSSESESRSRATGLSEGETTSSGESLSFGQEYLNKHAEACLKLLDRTRDRFETARAEGCWNVGVYLISDQSEAAAQAQAQFKAVVSGEKSTFEPIRVHDLSPLWDGQIQVALDAFQPCVYLPRRMESRSTTRWVRASKP